MGLTRGDPASGLRPARATLDGQTGRGHRGRVPEAPVRARYPRGPHLRPRTPLAAVYRRRLDRISGARSVSLFRRSDSRNWYVLVRWRGYPKLYLSTSTPNKARARAIEHTLFALRG